MHIHEVYLFQMMKDWAAARQRVQELKSRDPKAAEKLNKEITSVSVNDFLIDI